MEQPRVKDNDRDEITVTLDGKELRGWSYRDESERRVKMLAAREFCEGWFQASRSPDPRLAMAREALEEIARGYDSVATFSGSQCSEIARATLTALEEAS